MAVQDCVLVMPAGNGTSTNNIYNATLANNVTSGVITPGSNAIVRISSSQAVRVRFGKKLNLLAPGTTSDVYIPANMPTIVDMGFYNDSLELRSLANGNIITVTQLSKN